MSSKFPISSLPVSLRYFVKECAAMFPCSPDMLALPLLVTLGAAIGNSRSVKVKRGWLESAAIYGAMVADTGSMKTPVLKLVTDPLRKAQTGNRRTWASDTTQERLAELLQEHPRGLLISRDELTGFVRSMNQYKRKGGSDREFYMSCWSGESIVVDRKQLTVDQKKTSIHVARPFVSLVGCIPPALLPQLTLGDSLEDGFLQRILFAEPVHVPVRLTRASIDEQASAVYAELINSLLALDGQAGEPQVLELTDDAWDLYQQWHDSHSALSEGPSVSLALRGFYNKHKGYCVRLALIHAVSSDPDAYQVNVESIRAAIDQTEYFKEQSAKVVSRLGVGVGTVGKGSYTVWKCQEEIKRMIEKGGIQKKREVQRSLNYEAEVFNPAWNNLIKPLQLVKDSNGNLQLIQMQDVTYPDLLTGTDIPTTDTSEDPPPVAA